MSRKFIFISLIIIFIVSVIFSLSFGGSNFGISDVLKYFFNPESVSDKERLEVIIFNVRLPRTIVTVVSGACLATSGVLIQAVLKNPLGDSGILGIQSGATLIALIIMLMFPEYSGYLALATFFGGFLVYLLIMVSSMKTGLNPIRLVLTGVSINALVGALIGIITIYNSDKIQNALAWLNGSFASVDMQDAILISIYGGITLIISLFLVKKCNILLLDDSTIITIGENLSLTRFIVASIAVLLASIPVSFVGIIGFIGLVIPHIGRMIVGSRHEVLIPFSIIAGAILTTFADGFQKMIFNPIEIPAGTIISFVGASFFFYLLSRKQVD